MKKYFLIFLFLLFSTSLNFLYSSQKPRQFQTSDGVKLYLKVSGKGEPCIFIHGGPGAWSKPFENLGGNNLESKMRMIYYDQRGCGRSENAKTNDYSLDRMVSDIEDIRNFLKIDKVVLMSHSFGGILAVNYAKKYPKHVKGLILVNSTLNIFSSLRSQLEYINQLTDSRLELKSDDSLYNTLRTAMKLLNVKGLSYKTLTDNESSFKLVDMIDQGNKSKFEFARKFVKYKEYFKDYTTYTKDVDKPVLIISGNKDNAVGFRHYKLFTFPNSEVKEINGGNLLYFEENAEFKKAVFTFISNKKRKKK